jgi:fructosamine-3-kinase
MVPAVVLKAITDLLTERHGRDPKLSPPQAVGGGCINPSARLKTGDGESCFLKWNEGADPEMFPAEADGLRALAGAGALRVPEVLGWGGACSREDPGWLLLEFISSGPRGRAYGSELGEGLARLHGAGVGVPFGWHRDNFIGSLPQRNREKGNWARFWRDLRIEPQLRLAREGGFFRGSDGKVLDTLLDRMEEILPAVPEAGTALLHGDLWSGNYYPDLRGLPVLIDPAVYWGDGEVDLAMMELFGSLPPGFREAYDGTRGISRRYGAYGRDLYQLYYLLVHVNLFGGGYVGGSLRAARSVLAAT